MDVDTEEPQPVPLNVLVVGAGIGGLTAALGLRRQGHIVTVFERSWFANELGAAIHLPPNANGILRRFGLIAEDTGAVDACWLTSYSPSGELQSRTDLYTPSKLWQHSWLLCHRVDLHNELKRLATSEDGAGHPVTILTSSRAVEIDCDTATLTLENEETRCGDLIVVADGVHSKLRNQVVGKVMTPFSSGKCAFRFLIPKEELEKDPRTKKFVEKDGEMISVMGSDRRIFAYRCRYNQLLNLVCHHPDTDKDAVYEGWSKTADKKDLMETYKSFGPDVLALLDKVAPQTLKLWQLLDLEALPTWVKGRIALLGDAAHPFLPYQGQGGAQAIEDAASLAVMLPLGVKVEEINDRLRLYEKCRYERATKIQQFTREAGVERDELGNSFDIMQYLMYNFGHDEWHYSSRMLQKWLRARNPNASYSTIVPFGPYLGPMTKDKGANRIHAGIRFTTSKTFLKTLFPSDDFSFQNAPTLVLATLQITSCDNLKWLGGAGYSTLQLVIHGVQCKGKDGGMRKGSYIPVQFANNADVVLRNREGFGLPTLYSSLQMHRRQSAYSMVASWSDVTFAEFSLGNLEPYNKGHGVDLVSSGLPETENNGDLYYRYIAAPGEPGKSSVEYPVFSPYSEPDLSGMQTYATTEASFRFQAKERNTLPTLHHVTSKLAEIPVYKVLFGYLSEGKGGEEDDFCPRRI